MASTTCPRCGREAEGNFCSWCGAGLEGGPCPSCGAEPEAGARFCNACGAVLAGDAPAPGDVPAPGAVPWSSGTRGGGRGARDARNEAGGGGVSGSNFGWWVAGAFMVALIVVVALPIVMPEDQGGEQGAAPAAGPMGEGGVDLGSMTPREAADRLYARVMTAAETGDSAEVTQFLPMAISAYEMVRPLDADGRFHLALLQRTGGDFEGALATARQALEESPDHLLNLAAAAEAAAAMGDSATAREYYGHLLEVWDAERARGLQEYEMHSPMLPGLREEAQEFVGG